MRFKTILGLIVGTIVTGLTFPCAVLAKGAYSEAKAAKKAKEEAKTEESKTEEKPAEEEKSEE